jgi:hypothetical protein
VRRSPGHPLPPAEAAGQLLAVASEASPRVPDLGVRDRSLLGETPHLAIGRYQKLGVGGDGQDIIAGPYQGRERACDLSGRHVEQDVFPSHPVAASFPSGLRQPPVAQAAFYWSVE